MEGLNQYIIPYLLSQVVAIVIIMMAYRNTRITRILFGLMFLGASVINMSAGINDPTVYVDYGKMALPFYRDFIIGWFSQHNNVVVPAIAVAQFFIGLGMILRGTLVKLACIGAILFFLGITPLMVGSAFPFPLFAAWAAWVVYRRDDKGYVWQKMPVLTKLKQSRFGSAELILSAIAVMLTLLATETGLFVENIYNDNEFVQTAWRANDWITLLLVVPAMLIVMSMKKTNKVHLVWSGLLGYLVYNYAFYLVGASFNGLFLVYAGIIASSIWSIVGILQKTQIHLFSAPKTVNRWISGFLFFIALMLVTLELPPVMNYWFTGEIPSLILTTGHVTSIVYALDMILVIPTCIVAGYWLLKDKGWGIALSAIMLVKAVSYGAVLTAGTILLQTKGTYDPALPFYIFLSVAGCMGLIWLLKQLTIKEIIPAVSTVTPAEIQSREEPLTEELIQLEEA